MFVGLLLQQTWRRLLLDVAGKQNVAVAALMSARFHSVTWRRSGRRSDGALDHFTHGLVQVVHGRHRLWFSHRAAGGGALLLLNNGYRGRGVVVVKVVCRWWGRGGVNVGKYQLVLSATLLV